MPRATRDLWTYPLMKLVSIPANPVPEGAVTGILKTPDCTSIRFARWPAPASGRKGTVCVFHGRIEFIEKYFEVVRDLNARGFAVATIDWRGQGLSTRLLREPRKGHVANFAEYDTDLETFMRDVVLPDCPPPLFALANSMGATVMLRAAAKGYRWFDRMVLCAPMIKLSNIPLLSVMPAVARSLRLAGFGGSFIPGGGPSCSASGPFLDNPVTSDPIRHARTAAVIEAEPSLALGAPTIAWADAALRAMADFARPSYPTKLRQPILIIACGRDRLVSTAAIEDFGNRLPAGSYLVVPGAKHEVMMEQDLYRSQFWAAFDAFIPGTPAFV
jgi:lysophospholipase